MKISIFGLGYVGAVSAGCLATDGHEVIGVDPNRTKVELINQGTTPIIEKDIGEMIAATVKSGHLRATADVRDAVFGSDMSLICVGTPSQLNGNLDLSHVRKVCQEIGAAIAEKDTFHVVVARSTMLPGSMRSLVIPTLEAASGKVAGVDFGVCNNPEFLREGTAVYDYYNPPKTVIGESDEKAGALLVQLYEKMDAPLVRTDVETAEMVKYTDNTWHAVKVAFANEIGNICKAVGIDGHKVMDIFCQDTKLNLSPYYMKPGFAFGGSCLPKDVRALTYRASSLDVEAPLLNSLMRSNESQVQNAFDIVAGHDKRKVALLGLSFKAGTDDLRESPLVELAEMLIGKGFDLSIYDSNVEYARVHGANKDYIEGKIPHVSSLLNSDFDDVINNSDVIILGNRDEKFRALAQNAPHGKQVIDLVGFMSKATSTSGRTEGICW